MEKEPIAGQPETATTNPVDDLSVDIETTHEIAQRGSQLLQVSKELNSSSKALLEQLDPIV